MDAINYMTPTKTATTTWPLDRLTRLDNFGHSIASPAFLYRPSNREQLLELLDLAFQRGTQIALRGTSRSYGDAALNSGHVVLDMRRMNRILDWDPDEGVIRLEPGVTIRQLWEHTLEDGWWPPVVPGTMAPTLGGCLAMNVHGKNNYRAGPIGEHVLAFTALLPTGEELTCSPEEHADLFYAMIGGLGMLGVFTSITLQLKRVYSGDLRVAAWAAPDLGAMLEDIDAHKTASDYIVGWVDTTARGRGIGRGQLHSADYLGPGEDPHPAHTLSVAYQTLPDTILGLVPKSITWRLMRPLMNNTGAWAVNTAKYLTSRTIGHQKQFHQSFAAFNFLLDYVPHWERAYGPGGLIQYQCFVPQKNAREVFETLLRRSQAQHLPSYLGVLKRHRPDPFLLSHAVDGFSLALDFRVTRGNRSALNRLAGELSEVVLDAGGRFYFAKDSTLTRAQVERFLGAEVIARFRTLKRRCDPEGLLESDLYRRCFRPHPV